VCAPPLHSVSAATVRNIINPDGFVYGMDEARDIAKGFVLPELGSQRPVFFALNIRDFFRR
jgi:hypothetical protein